MSRVSWRSHMHAEILRSRARANRHQPGSEQKPEGEKHETLQRAGDDIDQQRAVHVYGCRARAPLRLRRNRGSEGNHAAADSRRDQIEPIVESRRRPAEAAMTWREMTDHAV